MPHLRKTLSMDTPALLSKKMRQFSDEYPDDFSFTHENIIKANHLRENELEEMQKEKFNKQMIE